MHVSTAGIIQRPNHLLMGGGITRTLWNTAMIGVGDPQDEPRWKDLFTTAHSMGGIFTYALPQVERAAEDWKKNVANADGYQRRHVPA